MSTLLFERSLPRFAAARVVSSLGSGRGAGVGPLRLVERDAPEAPSAGWAHVNPVLSGICGSDLATLDGAHLALLRGHRLVPLRAGSRGGRHSCRRCNRSAGRPPFRRKPGGVAAGSRLCGSRDRPAVPRLPSRSRGQLWLHRLRAHPARAPDGLLCRYGGWLVDRWTRGALDPALRRARRAHQRGRGH